MTVTTSQDHELGRVPLSERKGFLTMFVIMLGFTFFSASMWTGQQLGAGLNLNRFILALFLGGSILGVYTALLAYIGAKTGLSMDLLAQHTFGKRGSYLPSFFISFTQMGWFGVGVAMFALPVANFIAPDITWLPTAIVLIAGACMTASAFIGIRALTIVSLISVPLIAILGTASIFMAVSGSDMGIAAKFAQGNDLPLFSAVGLVVGSFISGGTATPNFTRFAKTPKVAVLTTVIAFFLGNSLMFTFGAVSGVFVGGNDIFEVMISLNLGIFAVIVLGLNIWTTNDNALYTVGLGLSNITKQPKRPLVLISGIAGTLAATWLYNNFCGWLSLLNATLPPVGAILIIGYFCHRNEYNIENEVKTDINYFAVFGVIIGATVANLLPYGISSINSMLVAGSVYLVGELVADRNQNQLGEVEEC